MGEAWERTSYDLHIIIVAFDKAANSQPEPAVSPILHATAPALLKPGQASGMVYADVERIVKEGHGPACGSD